MKLLNRISVGLIWLLAVSAGLAQDLNWVKVTSYLTARAGHAMAYDAARGQVVLFGGWNGGPLSDTWVWDGSNWVPKFSASRPPARFAHAMAYDAARGADRPVRGNRFEWPLERHLGLGRGRLGTEIACQQSAGAS